MATVIDTLIIQLGLDPRQFNAGQRQALQQATQFQRQMTQQIANVLRPITNTNQQLNSLSTNARRAGLALNAGARAGQSGFLALAAAGTAAYTAIKAVQGIYNQFTSTIDRTASLARAAQSAGVAPNYLSRLQVAAYSSRAAVPHEQTQSSVIALQRHFQNLPLGNVDQGRLRGLGMLGVNTTKLPGESEENFINRVLTQAADKLKEVRDRAEAKNRGAGIPAAEAAGANAGFEAPFSRFLSGGGAAFRRSLGAAGGVAVRPEDAEAAERMAQAIRNLSEAWGGFLVKLQTANPQWTEWIDRLTKFLTEIQNSPGAMEKFGKAFEAVFAVSMVAALGIFVGAVKNASTALAANPLGRAILAAWAVKEMAERTFGEQTPEHAEARKKFGDWTPWLDWRKWFGFGPYGGGKGPKGEVGGGGSEGYDDRGVSNTRSGSGIRGGGGVGGGVTGISLSPQAIRAHAYAAGFRGADLDKMVAIALHESGGGNPNAISSTGDYGLTQINAKAHGMDVAKSTLGNPGRAMELAYGLYSKAGNTFRDWSSYNSGAYKQYMGAAAGGGGGQFSSGGIDLSKVNPALVSTAQAAAAGLPEGYRVVATSGARTGGLRNSRHHGGGAMDLQIIGPNGPIPNEGKDSSGLYTRFAHSWYNAVARMHPELLSKAAWGGEFGTRGTGSTIADLMHIDFGGRRGGISQSPWAYLDDATKAAGMGNLQAGGATGVGNTINHGDVTVQKVDVHTQATDAKGISYAIGGALKDRLATAQANTGLM